MPKYEGIWSHWGVFMLWAAHVLLLHVLARKGISAGSDACVSQSWDHTYILSSHNITYYSKTTRSILNFVALTYSERITAKQFTLE